MSNSLWNISESDFSDETVLLSELIFDLKAFDGNRDAREIIFCCFTERGTFQISESSETRSSYFRDELQLTPMCFFVMIRKNRSRVELIL